MFPRVTWLLQCARFCTKRLEAESEVGSDPREFTTYERDSPHVSLGTQGKGQDQKPLS